MIIKLFNGQAGKKKKGEMFMLLSDIKKMELSYIPFQFELNMQYWIMPKWKNISISISSITTLL